MYQKIRLSNVIIVPWTLCLMLHKLPTKLIFFDNSKDGEDFKLFAHFKNPKGEKIWDPIDEKKPSPTGLLNIIQKKVGL